MTVLCACVEIGFYLLTLGGAVLAAIKGHFFVSLGFLALLISLRILMVRITRLLIRHFALTQKELDTLYNTSCFVNV